MTEYAEIRSVNDLNGGVVDDLFQVELKKVLNNIADENTRHDVVREISINVKIKPTGEERESAETTVEVKSKLASPKKHVSMVFFRSDGKDVAALARNGEPEQPKISRLKLCVIN